MQLLLNHVPCLWIAILEFPLGNWNYSEETVLYGRCHVLPKFQERLAMPGSCFRMSHLRALSAMRSPPFCADGHWAMCPLGNAQTWTKPGSSSESGIGRVEAP